MANLVVDFSDILCGDEGNLFLIDDVLIQSDHECLLERG